MRLQYSHCIKATPGQLDQFPHTQYEARTVDVALDREFDGEEPTYTVTQQGEIIGSGDAPSAAVFDAAYNLMNQSREAALMAACVAA